MLLTLHHLFQVIIMVIVIMIVTMTVTMIVTMTVIMIVIMVIAIIITLILVNFLSVLSPSYPLPGAGELLGNYSASLKIWQV